MAYFDWNPSYSVKVSSCDAEHKKLFALINDLYEAMRVGKGSTVIGKVLDELQGYTVYHFTAEEELMVRAGYPELQAHRKQHQEFVARVGQFKQELTEGATGQAVAASEFLNNWLVNHIQRTDKEYSSHLNSRGIS